MASTPTVSGDILAKYEPVIGLEVHVQLLTASKIFCSCSTRFGDSPNTNVCPVCLGLPGALPVLNRKAVEFAALAAMALECRVNRVSIFARKNYFYPDLPKGYQISQYDKPLAEFGFIDIDVNGGKKKIGITRLHLEEDAGKSLHEGFADSAHKTAIDLNRTGVPLAEIVSEPDMRSAEEAYEYLTRLKEIILYTGVSDCNMEEGSLRCDANISVRPRGQKEFGTKTEVKNVNSFRFVKQALEYEIERHIEVLESGGKIAQETHLWDPARKETRPMRSKEYANDYRYFPEPDLPPLIVPDEMVERVRASMPELPADRKARYVREGLTEYEAGVLLADRDVADYFEATLPGLKNRKSAANWVMTEVLRVARDSNRPFVEAVPPAIEVGALLRMVEAQKISLNAAKTAFAAMVKSGKGADATIAELGLAQVSDESAIAAACDKVLAAETEKVAEYRAGRDKLFGFFVGAVMKEMGGKANPKVINEILRKKLAG